jgi:hypothetical protein
LVIDRADGPAVEQFDTEYRLTVSGPIEGRLIGGMTFYVAPDSAFGDPEHRHCDADVSVDVPWRDLDCEGELEIKLRFRGKS